MSEDTQPGNFCERCGSHLRPGSRFCEECGAAVVSLSDVIPAETGEKAVETATSRSRHTGTSRGTRVLLALGIVAGTAIAMGWWIASTRGPDLPPGSRDHPASEDLFPVRPMGIDSINNTIDGKKVAITGDGMVMQSPGLGVNRPVWCLVGPEHAVFSGPVSGGDVSGQITLRFQLLIPETVTVTDESGGVSVRLSLIDGDGVAGTSEHRFGAENRWQPLQAVFPYRADKAPHRLCFEARGFDGAIYIDSFIPSSP